MSASHGGHPHRPPPPPAPGYWRSFGFALDDRVDGLGYASALTQGHRSGRGRLFRRHFLVGHAALWPMCDRRGIVGEATVGSAPPTASAHAGILEVLRLRSG